MRLVYYLIENGTNILLFSLFPLIGIFILKRFSETKTIIILSLASILFLPVLLGYSYVTPFINELFFLLLISCIYRLVIPNSKLVWITFGVAFFCFMLIMFFGKMMGTLNKKDEWNISNYKIEYLEERGFSGGPLLEYRLSRYTKIPIFIKELEIKLDTDTIRNCLVKFEKSKFTFNKCGNLKGRDRLIITPLH